MISEAPFSREAAGLQVEALLAHEPGPWLHTLHQVRRIEEEALETLRPLLGVDGPNRPTE